MTLTPGRRKTLALLLGWASVVLVFLSLARPVREWAGHHWSHLVFFVTVPAAVIGCVLAAGLWRGGSRKT